MDTFLYGAGTELPSSQPVSPSGPVMAPNHTAGVLAADA
jgi:hypothetical protein